MARLYGAAVAAGKLFQIAASAANPPSLEIYRVEVSRCHNLPRVSRALFYTMLALQFCDAAAAEPQQVRIEGARFVGAAGCKSSSCHGGAGEKRSQYITWLRHDTHTRAFAILTNARSERIAEALKLPEAREGAPRAGASVRCTICHAPFHAIPQAQRLPGADPGESVSCESCHGAAGSWLRGHTRPDWTYATRIGAGMRDLKSLYVRANTCVACHQNLDADIVAAGHPALVFELDSQSVAQPKHWRDEEGSGARAWLTGQAVALRELSWHLAVNPAPNPQSLAQWRALVWLLGKVTAAEGALLPITPVAAGGAESFTRTQQQADALARRAAHQNLGAQFATRLTRTLAGLDAEFLDNPETSRELLFLRAQRLVLALELLADSSAPVGATAARAPELVELRVEMGWEGEFDAARFRARLARYHASVAGSGR